jgi:D-alanyl-D-alanine carboxypeptidase (penicillin-binding protein 5/6)
MKLNNKKRFFSRIASTLIASVLIISAPIMCFAMSSNYVWSSMEDFTALVSNNITASYTDDNSNPLNLDCGSAILIEQTTGQILYSYNSHEQLRPASVTKLMSILLIMEAIEDGKIDYDTQIPCSENAASMGGSQIWLDTTETLTVDEMLKAICVVSANDCVTAMAEYIGGSEENFVAMMNEKAKELGMNDTTFKNCHGIDEDGHVTSSYDISLMSRELLNKYPEITKYTTIWSDSLRDGKSELINTNKLVHNYEGCTGLKTGSTSLALYNLSASATRNGLSLIAVIMKAPTSAIRFSDAATLLNYGFNNFEFTSLTQAGEIVQNVQIEKGIVSSINAVSECDVGTLTTKGNDINIDKNISLEASFAAPINKGDVIGTVTFTLNGETVGSTNLIADASVDKINVFSMSKNVFNNWFNLLR